MMAASIANTFFPISQNNGVRQIRYRKVGHGKHVLLMLPGAVGTIETDFGPQIKELGADQFTLVCWDPPGYGIYGDAERCWETDMLDRDAELAVDLMTKHLNFKNFSILGFSDGANTAFLIAAKYPQFVDKIISVGGNAYADDHDIAIYEGTRDVSSWEETAKESVCAVYGLEKFSLLWNKWCDVMKKIFTESGGDFCKSALPIVTAKTLIVNGRHDEAVPLHHALYLSSIIPLAELWIVADAGHDVHLTRSECFNKVLTGFLLAD